METRLVPQSCVYYDPLISTESTPKRSGHCRRAAGAGLACAAVLLITFLLLPGASPRVSYRALVGPAGILRPGGLARRDTESTMVMQNGNFFTNVISGGIRKEGRDAPPLFLGADRIPGKPEAKMQNAPSYSQIPSMVQFTRIPENLRESGLHWHGLSLAAILAFMGATAFWKVERQPKACLHLAMMSMDSEIIDPALAMATSALHSSSKKLAERMCAFINASPSPFHVVEQSKKILEKGGFTRLSEREPWLGKLKNNGKYYFTRNNSSIIAFAIGGKYDKANGMKVIGAHTDSPNLQVKPVSATGKAGYQQVSVATYGGGLWHTWFDRDLTLAGRVVLQTSSGIETKLVHIKKPILKVPNLCIHLQSVDERAAFKVNKEDHICPILCTNLIAQLEGQDKESGAKHHPALMSILANEMKCKATDILDFELSVCDTQPAVLGGAFDEFIFGPRLDNLASSFAALEALVTAEGLEEDPQCRVIALFDNEEVGSETTMGAGCTHLSMLATRLCSDFQSGETQSHNYDIAMSKSLMISADMAHAIHPCYMGKHHELHRPEMHKGVVVKFNANQRYATTALTAAITRAICKKRDVPIQDFAVSNDTGCGSTIGPILSTRLGMKTVDVGISQLSMHSVRETCGTIDIWYYVQMMSGVFTDFHNIKMDDGE